MADANDYKQTANSPTIDKGVDLSLPLDYWGTSIPQGNAPDIGAHEYVGGATAYSLSCDPAAFTYTGLGANTLANRIAAIIAATYEITGRDLPLILNYQDKIKLRHTRLV